MALRIASRRLGSSALRARFAVPGLESQRFLSSSSPTSSNLPQDVQKTIAKDASLHSPDPPADSATVAFLNENTPYMVPTYVRPTPMMVKGEGCYLWDMENRQYLDLTAGIAVNSLGHCDPQVAIIVADQSKTLIHASNLYHSPWIGALSKLLISTTLESGAMRDASQVFISNSGTEANEAAIKFARKVGHTLDPTGSKHELVSFKNSFHGRTLGALSATPNPKYQKPFAPMLPGFKYGTYNDIPQLETLITDKTCGVIVEPIQGEGGVHTASPEFLSALRARCTAVGAVLIFDEIQCGLSRTGSLWAHAQPSLAVDGQTTHPDILTTAKALGNGIPIGATLVSGESVGKHIQTGDHGTTFGGNPLACRVAHHVLGRLASPSLQENVSKRSSQFRTGFDALRKKYPDAISEVRGSGLILGMQLSESHTSKASEILAAARERGLLVITAGEGCLRFVPPLTITEKEVEAGLEILGKAMEVVFSK
ncbi:acetylornithine aminotransferase [Arachnomyces sp. PD_36]|nr:acetylornithine aminotransferase [Arachnomyces sp. PD_36]